MRPPRSRSRGFTLIEVVVAFTMLSLVLAVSFEIFSGGLKRAGEMDDYARALMIAQSKIASVGTEEPFKEGQSVGQTEDGRFKWSVAVARTDEGLPPGYQGPFVYLLFRVNVKVDWQGADNRERSIALATLGLGSGL